ncbi:MAG: PIN domain-containing protein [Opitutaceae bacterium]|jgi:predicted nucleic acid-binding protein|nr:PIN domain-containing protein [Opitutaceae bacterium]
MINYLVDAGPLIALANKSDMWHEWSIATLNILGEPLCTTDAVLVETCHRLRRLRPAVHGILSLVKDGDIQICPIMPAGSGRILDLMKKYADIMDFGDATLVVLSEMHPRARLITVDRRDFSLYRRLDGSAVPTIMPDVE